MYRSSFEEILKQFKEFDSFLSSLGVPYKENDRIHLALDMMRKGNEKLSIPNEYDELVKKHGFETFYGACLELYELGQVIYYLKTQKIEIVRDKLKKILSGALLAKHETDKNNTPRNTMFEISLAERLNRRGIKAKLKDNPDILVTIHGRNYYIQCKRVFSEKSIPDNVSRAHSQLKIDLAGKDPKTNFGIIAISNTRVLNNGYENILVTKNERSGLDRLNFELTNLINKYKSCWQKISEKNIIAVDMEVSCISDVQDVNIISLANFMAFTDVHNVGSKDKLFATFRNDFYNLMKIKK